MAQASENFGTYHISSNLQNYESARSSFFTFIVSGFSKFASLLQSGADRVSADSSDYIDASKAQEYLKLSVNSASVPHFSLDTITIRRGNSAVKFAGVPTFPEGSIQVQDFVGLDVKSILMAWQALAYDVTTDKGGRAGNWTDRAGVEHIGYKQDCELIEYTQDHEEIRRWKLVGCWISDLSEDQFDVTSDGDRKITATIQYDRAVMIKA